MNSGPQPHAVGSGTIAAGRPSEDSLVSTFGLPASALLHAKTRDTMTAAETPQDTVCSQCSDWTRGGMIRGTIPGGHEIFSHPYRSVSSRPGIGRLEVRCHAHLEHSTEEGSTFHPLPYMGIALAIGLFAFVKVTGGGGSRPRLPAE